MNILLKRLLSFLIIFPSVVFGEDICLKWFQTAGVKPGSKGCLISCGLIPIDMASFFCLERCDEFCKIKKCVPDVYWKNKLKNGVPKNWDFSMEVPTAWTNLETDQMTNILNQLPDSLKDLPIEGVFRAKKSVDVINPATTSKNGKEIVIYDRAFQSPFWSLSSVVTHEIGHVVFINLSSSDRKAYSALLGWKMSKGVSESRSGEFISSRARDSLDEDFAENFSFFLLSRNELKLKVPKGYEWFIKKYKENFKLKEDCNNEKK